MNIYKLNYPDKDTAIRDLLMKKAYVRTKFDNQDILSFGEGIQAVVEIGKIVLENGTYDENFKELTPTTYADGYSYDIMSENEINFGKVEIFPNSPGHSFAGYNTTK